MKTYMLRLTSSPSGEEYFELNKSEPGTVLTSKLKITLVISKAPKIIQTGKSFL
jgi:hypothetical protein